MRSASRSKQNDKWLKCLGENIEKLILEKGYESHYDFWVNSAGDSLSRSALNYIINGKTDPKITTLKAIAVALEIDVMDLLDF